MPIITVNLHTPMTFIGRRGFVIVMVCNREEEFTSFFEGARKSLKTKLHNGIFRVLHYVMMWLVQKSYITVSVETCLLSGTMKRIVCCLVLSMLIIFLTTDISSGRFAVTQRGER